MRNGIQNRHIALKILHLLIDVSLNGMLNIYPQVLGFRQGQTLSGSLLACGASLALLEWIHNAKVAIVVGVATKLSTMTRCVHFVRRPGLAVSRWRRDRDFD